ncbi:acyl-CoA oxidase [Exophiala aquamarina CBS 119918]|uniref:Acyl-coenzyme A oxidase n=1 Tax=Exophiala aquamarina CBS 119918 TaxID=1182545 RepID=A0A072NY48_9EURO|nr:acyl-CoA oxidase [Exophiala aquamarina CBS 119918]KEF52327.1 acyl-CoA oxidase [Exophiala aquamarina CBS 119918]
MSLTPKWVQNLKPSGPQGHELLTAERTNSFVKDDEIATFMFSELNLKRDAAILQILKADPAFDKRNNYYAGRIDRIRTALARGKRLQQLSAKHGWSEDEYQVAYDLIGEATPYGLHAGMFTKTLREQCTPEQQAKFLKAAIDYEIIGCYAQTELGHGSNVKGIETTATWVAQSQTFEIHSPYLTASKWWIGSLGKAANHAVVMAQLLIEGKSYGPHLFLVKIRDLSSHQPLPQVYVGDIGPKVGFNTMDNGFLLFDHLQIPHENMLARFANVDPLSGKYYQSPNPSLVYGTMTWVRSNIVLRSGRALARGVTIAVRYCAVRRQFVDRDNAAPDTETQVLDYTMVQHRLFPLLAATFALHFTGKKMIQMYQNHQAAGGKALIIERPTGPEEAPSIVYDANRALAQLHALSCALKALTSTIAGEGLETCRRACGGHGYSAFAGIGAWAADYLPTLTWEGDNYMLTQQVSRYLLKAARQVRKNQHRSENGDAVQLLADYTSHKSTATQSLDFELDDAGLIQAFRHRVGHQTFDLLRRRDQEGASWNSLLVDFWKLSTAYAQYSLVRNFKEALQDATQTGLAQGNIEVLHNLFRLYALSVLSQDFAGFLKSGAYTPNKLVQIEAEMLKLLLSIRPHAVKLVDAWKLSDWQLDSSLGRSDGKVYEDLFHRASVLNPLNLVTFDSNPRSPVLFREWHSQPSKL